MRIQVWRQDGGESEFVAGDDAEDGEDNDGVCWTGRRTGR